MDRDGLVMLNSYVSLVMTSNLFVDMFIKDNLSKFNSLPQKSLVDILLLTDSRLMVKSSEKNYT
jgi:hypothetical protein